VPFGISIAAHAALIHRQLISDNQETEKVRKNSLFQLCPLDKIPWRSLKYVFSAKKERRSFLGGAVFLSTEKAEIPIGKVFHGSCYSCPRIRGLFSSGKEVGF